MLFIKAGQIIDGLFKVTKPRFKKGAAGEIHLAQDPQGNPVVLKFPTQGGIVKDMQQFKREYKALLKFSHPNVARAFHFGEVEGSFFIASEFVDGQEFQKATVGLTPAQMMPLFIQALEGLEAIHNLGMLHLDIKSSNVLVTKDHKVKIIDFGLTVASIEMAPNRICGTLLYMSPEMIFKQGVDNRADLFAMGVLLYYCLTGNYPFPNRKAAGRDMLKLQQMVREEEPPLKPTVCNSLAESFLDEIILNLLTKNPQERFGSARAVINALKTHHPEDYHETPEAKGSYLIPEGNRHIGREVEQKQIEENLQVLAGKKEPATAVFYIHGVSGLGKTHLLKKIKEQAEGEAEKFSIHYLELKDFFPDAARGEEWLGDWISFFNQRLAENKKPLLVLIDNVDLAAKPLQAMLENIFKLLMQRQTQPNLFQEQMPMMLCLASRKSWQDLSPFQEIYPWPVRVELQPFALEEVRDYLSQTPALKNKALPTAWIKTLHLKTQGNPAELKERLREQDSKGLLFGLGGEILMAHIEDTSVEVTDDEAIPQTTRQRLSAVIGELTGEEERILDWIALMTWKDFIRAVTIADLEAMMGRNHILPVLNSLVSKGILIHDKDKNAYRFSNNFYMPVLIYQGLDEAERARRHQQVSQYLLETSQTKGWAKNAILFHEAYGENKKAAFKAILKLGGEMLYDEGKPKFAKTLFERALLLVKAGHPKAHLFFTARLIEACCYSGAYAEAQKYFDEAKGLVQNAEMPHTLRIALIVSILPCFIDEQKFDQAGLLIDEALQLFSGGIISWYLPLLHNFEARIFYKKFFSEKGRGEELLQQAKKAYEISETLESDLSEHQKTLIRNNDLGSVLKSLGLYEAAIEKLKKKYQRLKKNTNVFIEFSVLTDLAESYRLKNEYDFAVHFAVAALERAQRTGQGKWILHAHHILAGIHQTRGMFLASQGKGVEAKKEFQQALEENTRCLAASVCLEERTSASFHLQGIFIRKGQCYEELKNWNVALTHFKAALDYNPSNIFLAIACLGLGECYVQLGDLEKARQYLDQSQNCLKNLPNPVATHCHFKILQAQSRCFLKEKNRPEVETRLKEMQALAAKDPVLAIEFKRFQGECGE